MKKNKIQNAKFKAFFKTLTVCLLLCFSSCATLQQDIYTSTEESADIYSSIEIYESQFINIDCQYHTDSQPPLEAINRLLTGITTYRVTTNVTEPLLIARLRAFEGLLNKMAGKTWEAEAAYQEAKNLQKGDRYVQLLGTRLEKTIEKSLSTVDDILFIDEKNSIILLEKGKLLYRQNRFNEAVAVFDNAFMLFDSEGYKEYRQAYTPLRNNAWELNKISDVKNASNFDNIDLQANLNLKNMVELTLSNSTLLDSYKISGKQKLKTDKLIQNLEKSGYFSSAAAKDQKNQTLTSADMLNAQFINRKLCARFIWNAYVRKNGNLSMLSRYSDKYKKANRTKSPVFDVPVEDIDFDAVLGVIENEFMEMPDGKNFNPEEAVTNLQFITWLKKTEK